MSPTCSSRTHIYRYMHTYAATHICTYTHMYKGAFARVSCSGLSLLPRRFISFLEDRLEIRPFSGGWRTIDVLSTTLFSIQYCICIIKYNILRVHIQEQWSLLAVEWVESSASFCHIKGLKVMGWFFLVRYNSLNQNCPVTASAALNSHRVHIFIYICVCAFFFFQFDKYAIFQRQTAKDLSYWWILWGWEKRQKKPIASREATCDDSYIALRSGEAAMDSVGWRGMGCQMDINSRGATSGGTAVLTRDEKINFIKEIL